jgi:hypothetical protein
MMHKPSLMLDVVIRMRAILGGTDHDKVEGTTLSRTAAHHPSP